MSFFTRFNNLGKDNELKIHPGVLTNISLLLKSQRLPLVPQYLFRIDHQTSKTT